MTNSQHRADRSLTAIALTLAALPAFVFYILLWKTATLLPIADDYHAELDFANQFVKLHGFLPRILHVLTFQQNEYKLIFANAITALQLLWLGHVNLLALALAGNFFVAFLFVVIVLSYRRAWEPDADRALLLLPVSLLVFQLQYASTMDWATCTLQNVAVVPFSLAAIYFLCREDGRSSVWGCVSMAFAIACSGNGFMVVPVGALILFRQKRWKQMAIWLMVFVGMVVIYVVRYDSHNSQAAPGTSVWRSLLRINPLYILSFLGSSLARYTSWEPSVILGIILCGLFGLAIKKRYDAFNPTVFYSMVFVFLTAFGVSGLRSSFGIAQSLASRYRIYSNLLLLFTLIFLSETYGMNIKRKTARRSVLFIVVSLCFLFCAASDVAGYQLLKGRRTMLEVTFANAQHPSASVDVIAASRGDVTLLRQLNAGLYIPRLQVLAESERLGVYKPPK